MRPPRADPVRQRVEVRGAMALGATSAAVYGLTAMTALYLAYDRPAAWSECSGLLVGLAAALILALVAGRHPRSRLGAAGVGCAVAAASIAVVGVGARRMDEGAAAALLTILVPLAACGLNAFRGRVGRLLTVVTAAGMVAGTVAITATGEVSAMSGVLAAALVGGWLWWRSRRSAWGWTATFADGCIVAALAAAAALYIAVMLVGHSIPLANQLLSDNAIKHRELWQDGMVGIRDYWLTGTGLAGSGMLMSSYLSLRHVPYHPHLHHLFLQTALEQGIPGLVGLIGLIVSGGWMVASALRASDDGVQSPACSAGAALAALCVAGLMESDLAGGFLQAGLFLPFGFAWSLGAVAPGDRTPSTAIPRRFAAAAVLAPLTAIVTPLVWPGAEARLHANWGAVLQTRAELRVYRWPEWSIQDRLRRERIVDLEPAVAQYESALALDGGSVTALRRLGQIELSRGEYQSAFRRLELAARLAPRDRVATRLLAEASAVNGNAAAAATLWNAAGTGADELGARLWWYTYVGDPTVIARFQESMRALEQLHSASAGQRTVPNPDRAAP